jgi:hypothetical protein
VSSSRVTTIVPPSTDFISKPLAFKDARMLLGQPSGPISSGVAAGEAVEPAAAAVTTTKSPAPRAASTAQNPPNGEYHGNGDHHGGA